MPVFHCWIIFMVGFWPFSMPAKETRPLKKTALDLPASLENLKNIRILIRGQIQSVQVVTLAGYEISDAHGRTLAHSPKILQADLQASKEGIRVGLQNYPVTQLIIKCSAGIRAERRVYRHRFKIVRQASGKLLLINELPIEDYLKGVMAWEANPQWKMEALKAQAITSRTYALFKAIENQQGLYDLSSDVLSQVYGGKNAEHPVTDEAVEQTRGKILTYQGKIFTAYFHSTCGGGTSHAEYQWDVQAHPALEGVECSFCRSSKHYRWKVEWRPAEIIAVLKKHGFMITEIRKIGFVDVDSFGRARTVLIEHEGGMEKIRANDFRLWLDPWKLKSTLVDRISEENGNIVIQGRGWGHGVGLCQYGMKTLAELGYTHDQIVQYYYPGSQITDLQSKGY